MRYATFEEPGDRFEADPLVSPHENGMDKIRLKSSFNSYENQESIIMFILVCFSLLNALIVEKI